MAAIILGVGAAFVSVSCVFILQARQYRAAESTKRLVTVIGFEEEGIIGNTRFLVDSSFPVSSLVDQIDNSNIDEFEILMAKKVGSLRNQCFILPRKNSKTLIVEIPEIKKYYRFDFPINLKIEKLQIEIEKKLGKDAAKKIVGKKKKIPHVQTVTLL